MEVVERKRLTNEIWEQMLQKVGHRCLACGQESFPMSQDHIIPIEKGGTNDADNIQPLCLLCNQKKGVKDTDWRPAEWPWRLKSEIVLPDETFREMQNYLQLFLARSRSSKSTFISKDDPHVTFKALPGGYFEMKCTACFETAVTITQDQLNHSLDNVLSEAHVAWHLVNEAARKAVEDSERFKKFEESATRLYLPLETQKNS